MPISVNGVIYEVDVCSILNKQSSRFKMISNIKHFRLKLSLIWVTYESLEGSNWGKERNNKSDKLVNKP